METLQQQKKARTIGVSNFCPKCLECISADPTLKVVPAVNQFEHHIGMGPDAEGIKAYCKSKGIVAQAYSPLGPTFNQTAKDILIEGPLTTSIGKAHNKSGAQVALKWVVQGGMALVTRALNPEYLVEDLDLFDWTLSGDEAAKLNAATEPAAQPCLFCHGGGGN